MHNFTKAIFLDRDGVINELIFYPEEGTADSPNKVEQFRVNKRVGEALREFKKLGFLLIIISNQPGIAKGKYDTDEFEKIQHKMEKELEPYAILDKQYYCLHHPEAKVNKYRKKCDCRKPNTKLVFDAKDEFNINLDESFIIGDGTVDMELAKNVTCRSIFIGNINSTTSKIFKEKNIEPNYIAHSLFEAMIYVRNQLFQKNHYLNT